jgi:NADPH-dependent 2,4-dienoyl-CoA reductase/sulfur reductase-like enzyme
VRGGARLSRLLIVGGSDAGISAALRARELDRDAEVSVLLADRYPNYSICGLPYFLSGEVPDWHALAHRTIDELEESGTELLLEHTAERIDPGSQSVSVRGADNRERWHRYDSLIVATGAAPVRPPIPGIERDGVYQLHTIGDSLTLNDALARGPESAVIVGAGYIGLEMAEALSTRGLRVSIVEQLSSVLPTVDPELGALVRAELERNGVRVATSTTVIAIDEQAGQLVVTTDSDLAIAADVVLVVVGVKPDTRLGLGAGIRTGVRGALQVNRRMETNRLNIYAAGDCTVTYHRLLDQDTYLPLGTTAHKQGRIAGENAVGGERFEGSLGTQVVKVFELAIARTGLRDPEAPAAGFEPLTVESRGYDHKVYYPGAHEIATRITGDRHTGRLLGAQLLGHLDAEVPKRIDIAAAALHYAMTVDALSDLDLSYALPFGTPWDAVQHAAQSWSAAAASSRAAQAGGER